MSVYPDQPTSTPPQGYQGQPPPQGYQGQPPPQGYQGQPYQPYDPQPPKQGASILAIGALVVGIIALFTSPYLVGIPVGLVAVGVGLAGRSRPGRKMALTGMWLGVAAIVIGLGSFLPQEEAELAADGEADETGADEAPAGQLATDAVDTDAVDTDAVDTEAAEAAASEAAAQAAEEQASEFSISLAALAVGDCFTSFTVGETVFSLTAVSCESEHEGEVFGAFSVDGMTEEEELAAEADRQCPVLLQEYLGEEAASFDGQAGYLFQTSGAGPRAVRCYIVADQG